jgi:type I restriction enzyme M protein
MQNSQLASHLKADLFGYSGVSDRTQSLPDAFRKIYFHLYSNSKASRAEVIIEDLSLLLLSKLSLETGGAGTELASFLKGKGTANKIFLPVLRAAFPELLDSKQSFALADSSLRTALEELSKFDLTHTPAHVLGEAFQALIGPRLRGERGQFFTPAALVRAMVEIVDPKPAENFCDPAAGTGGFLAQTHIYQVTKYAASHPSGTLIGVDKDMGLARLAGALLRVLCKERAHIYNFNSLSFAEWANYREQPVTDAFDVILTNPPFGTKIGIKSEAILRDFDLGRIWTSNAGGRGWLKSGSLSSSQDPQILFLELCVRALRPGGRMGIVLPEGVFGNRQTSYVWDWLEAQGEITALLDCPRTTFQPGTDTKTNVLFFRKTTKFTRPSDHDETRVAVALNCGHDRRGRTHLSNREPRPDDFAQISREFNSKEAKGVLWRNVRLRGVRYLVPRYHYDRYEATPVEQEVTRGARFATLGELAKDKVITIRKGHEVGSDAYGTGDIPFVRTSDLANFEISTDPTKAVSEEIYQVFGPQQRLKVGDVLIVVDGRYRIGMTAMVTEHSVRCVVQSHIRIISTIKRERLDPYELIFALSLPSVKLRMRSLVFIQSTLGTLGNRLMELPIPLLHGDGPWSGRVERFKEMLRRRASILAELDAMAGPDYEL